jgi:hypothetical protein
MTVIDAPAFDMIAEPAAPAPPDAWERLRASIQEASDRCEQMAAYLKETRLFHTDP